MTTDQNGGKTRPCPRGAGGTGPSVWPSFGRLPGVRPETEPAGNDKRLEALTTRVRLPSRIGHLVPSGTLPTRCTPLGLGHYEISLTIFSGYIVLSDNRVVASVWILEVRLVYPVPVHELEPVHNRALIGEEHQATVLDAIILRITRCGGR